MQMTDGEICSSYREAKNKAEQIQILADLNCTKRADIIEILIKRGEDVIIHIPSRGQNRKKDLSHDEYIKALFKRLDILDEQIAQRENEYREIVAVLKGGLKK